MFDELAKSLSSLGNYTNIDLIGLWGTYEEGMEFAATLPNDVPKIILWLGSSIGNLSREEGIEFIHQFQSKVMNPGDLFLIGIDRRNDPKLVSTAYNDPSGITEKFIMNGLNHVNAILEQPLIDPNDFEYYPFYNNEMGRHEAYYRVKKNLSLEYISIEDKTLINLEKGELVHIEYSYKYSMVEVFHLFHSCRLSHVESWPDSNSQYDLHLIYKPPFYFNREIQSQSSIPTIEEWSELWKAWDLITMTIITQGIMLENPISLRLPFIFYVGHIPSFLDINLAKFANEEYTEPQYFAEIFERGIDPDMDDPTRCHSHSYVPDQWPKLESIVEFRNKVRKRLLKVYETYKDKKMSRSLGRVLWMTFEHEAMHVETILYMFVQCERALPPKNVMVPKWRPKDKPAPKAVLLEVPTCTLLFGHDDSEESDDHDPLDKPFGWDNERPSYEVVVQSFKLQSRPVTNGEYLEFMRKTVNKQYPASWVQVNPSLFEYKVRTVFGSVDMNVAMNWPVMLNHEQASNYAEWTNMRLPTEEELRCFYDNHAPNPDLKSNIGFSHWHPTDVLPVQTIGSGWEWTSTEFSRHPNFTKSKLYPGYSEDFFDGKHNVVLGGSWATHPRFSRRTFRNWYQRSYPYVFCGVRLVQI